MSAAAQDGGLKPGAIYWLRTVCHAGGLCGLAGAEKNIRVLSLTEILVWGNRSSRS